MGKFAVGLLIVVLSVMLINVSRETGQAKGPVVPVPVTPQPEPYPAGQLAEDVRSLSESVSGLNRSVDSLTETTASIHQQLVSVTERVDVLETPSVVEQPAPQCVCTCECPTIDEVRTVVREELDKTAVVCKPPAQPPKPAAKPTPPVPSQPVASGPDEPIVEFVCDPVTKTCQPVQQVQQIQPVQSRGGLFRGLFRPTGR